MVLYSTKGDVLWNSKSSGNTDGYTLVMQNDDNLVLYSGGKPKWSSDTADSCEGGCTK